MIKYADVVVDLQAGDTGKGKVAYSLLKKPDEFTHVIRYNGGGNAGHTIYHNGQKVVTHFIPCGVLYGIKSIIGLGCVVNVEKLFKEIQELENLGFDVKSNLMIDKRVHIITDKHLEEDGKDSKIGTTKQGIGPAYRDKYGRVGSRAGQEPLLQPFICDIYDLHDKNVEVKALFEGAQGFELDIDWGDYPYVTSSHCTIGSAILNGFPPQTIREVYGVAKAYRTYVGAKTFEEPSEVFEKIRKLGQEFGATTGRKRQIRWFDVEDVIKAININGVTRLVINKLDILEQVGEFKLYDFGGIFFPFNKSEEFVDAIKKRIIDNCPTIKTITFSSTPYDI